MESLPLDAQIRPGSAGGKVSNHDILIAEPVELPMEVLRVPHKRERKIHALNRSVLGIGSNHPREMRPK